MKKHIVSILTALFCVAVSAHVATSAQQDFIKFEGRSYIGPLNLGNDGRINFVNIYGGGAGNFQSFGLDGSVHMIYQLDGTQGSSPAGELYETPDGTKHGVISYGKDGVDTLFDLTPDGEFTLGEKTLGVPPNGRAGCVSGYWTPGSDGEYITASICGGIDNSGFLLSVKDGAQAIFYSFLGGEDGFYPLFPPVQALGRVYYGVTQQGGHNIYGATFYKIENGIHLVLYSFPTYVTPTGILLADDGNLYVGTTDGNLYVFEQSMSPGQVPKSVTKLFSDEFYINHNLVQGDKLYGTAQRSIDTGSTTIIFSLDSAGKQDLATFDGASTASVLQAIDGNLYFPLSSLDENSGTVVGSIEKVTLSAGEPTPPPTPDSNLANISTRARVETGDGVLIAGFIVTGVEGASKEVVVRAIGPSLSSTGVIGAITDPTVSIYDSNGGYAIVENDNWQESPDGGAAVLAAGLAPTDPNEAAIEVTLQPGIYTAVVKGVDNTTGVGLVEVYDILGTTSKLANISTRGLVQTDDGVLIAGFIMTGTGPKNVVVRAIGPSLLHVAGVLADPKVNIYNGNGDVIAGNDNWQDSPDGGAAIIAADLAPANPKEAALQVTLNAAGAYTAVVEGVNGTTGVGLVEVYDIDQ